MRRFLAILLVLSALPGLGYAARPEVWRGDLDELISRRVIRVLVPYSQTYYFLDRGRPMGVTHEAIVKFERMINAELKNRHLKVHVVAIPTPRDKLLSSLRKGLGDIAAGNLTVTGKRKTLADFSDPFLTNVQELPVTGPEGPELYSLEDMAGKEVHVRKSSSYFESLTRLNRRFRSLRLKPVKIIPAEEVFEDEDLLEMVNAGVLPMGVVDSHKAVLWGKIFKRIKIYPGIVLRDGGDIAWAVRKKSPQLLAAVNRFVKTGRKGTLLGNIVFERYLEQTDYIRNPGSRTQFESASKAFRKYGETYKIDWLLLKALAFQESGIRQNKKSPKGAVGVMQILPSTAGDPNVNVPDIHKLDNNIHAGTKYLRFLMDRYFSDRAISPRDRMLLSLAAYNAGPRQISRLQREAEAEGLNPRIWFKNIEVVAARRIGRETVQYVNNIFKYYIAYQRIYGIKELKARKAEVSL